MPPIWGMKAPYGSLGTFYGTDQIAITLSAIVSSVYFSLRKISHAINRFFLGLKIENFQLNFFYIFLIFAQNIDCGHTLEPPRRGGSNECPQSMFWSKNKKNRYTPANPSFAI